MMKRTRWLWLAVAADLIGVGGALYVVGPRLWAFARTPHGMAVLLLIGAGTSVLSCVLLLVILVQQSRLRDLQRMPRTRRKSGAAPPRGMMKHG